MHNASMPNVTIRELPPEVHSVLVRRAEEAGMSLQQYLTSELTRLAERPTMKEVLDRVRQQSGGTVGLVEAVAALHSEREDRDQRLLRHREN